MPELAAIRSACSRLIRSHVTQQHHLPRRQPGRHPGTTAAGQRQRKLAVRIPMPVGFLSPVPEGAAPSVTRQMAAHAPAQEGMHLQIHAEIHRAHRPSDGCVSNFRSKTVAVLFHAADDGPSLAVNCCTPSCA